MTRKTLPQPALGQHGLEDDFVQLNIPPARPNGLWKVVVPGIKCPDCGSGQTKSRTGKRLNGSGLLEHYRMCDACRTRFRVVFE